MLTGTEKVASEERTPVIASNLLLCPMQTTLINRRSARTCVYVRSGEDPKRHLSIRSLPVTPVEVKLITDCTTSQSGYWVDKNG